MIKLIEKLNFQTTMASETQEIFDLANNHFKLILNTGQVYASLEHVTRSGTGGSHGALGVRLLMTGMVTEEEASVCHRMDSSYQAPLLF